MKKIISLIVMMVMIAAFGCTTYAESKIYVDKDENAVCIFDTEEDVSVVIFPDKIIGEYVICRKVGFEHGEVVTYVADWPSKLGTIFDIIDGQLMVVCANEEES